MAGIDVVHDRGKSGVVAQRRDGTGAIAAEDRLVHRIADRRLWVLDRYDDDDLVNAAYDALHAEMVIGDGPVGIGVIVPAAEVAARPEAVWPGTELLHVGFRTDGAQVRVRYFPEALVTEGMPGRLDPLPPREMWRDVFPLADGYAVTELGPHSPVSVEHVLALWAREGAVRPHQAEQRATEVRLVATHGDELVGVMTGYVRRNEQLGADVWYERAFVATEHRRTNLAVHLAVLGAEQLEQRHVEGRDTRGAGLVIEVEHPGLRSAFPQTIWPYTATHFIGESKLGATAYVRWFPDACIA